MARSANGSCTPTEFSSGGSANATGVTMTLEIRIAPTLSRPLPGKCGACRFRPNDTTVASRSLLRHQSDIDVVRCGRDLVVDGREGMEGWLGLDAGGV